jgi:hypothetical protein
MQLEHDPTPANTERGDEVEDRHSAIAKAAYQRAHSRNFEAGGELEDWLCAERVAAGTGSAGRILAGRALECSGRSPASEREIPCTCLIGSFGKV